MNSNTISKGLLWKLLERFGVLGSQFLLQLLLARLLDPEHYGVLAIMVVFTGLANVFIQAGFNTALIQNKDVTEEDYSSVLWVSGGVAVILYGVIFAAAPVIGSFYAMPEIVTPLRVLALMLFPGALNSVQLAKISREMDFRKVFFSNLSGILVSGAVSVAIALLGGGLWALVAQSILNVVVVCLVMSATSGLRLRPVCNWDRVKVLFSFSWKLMLSGLLDTLYQDLRSLVIGKKYDSATLGYYNRGKQFPHFLNGAINGSVQSVMLPALSALQQDRGQAKDLMRRAITLSAFLVIPMMAGLAGVAEPMVRLLLTEKWLPCVPYLQIYCFTFAFYPVHTCNLQAINAMGRSDVFLKLEVIKKTLGICILCAAVFCFDTPIAIASTGFVTTFTSSFINAYPNKKLIGYSYWEQIKDILPAMGLSLIMLGCVWLVGRLPLGDLPMLVLQILTGVAVYFALSALLRPKAFRILWGMVTEYLNKRKV